MGLTAEQLHASLDALKQAEPALARALDRVGAPEPRAREPGYAGLLRTIVSQQVSSKAANAVWAKLAGIGDLTTPAAIAAASDDSLRAAGLSRQKITYARSLGDEILSGRLDLGHLPEDDEQAIAALTQIKGIGRWSAEIYLLFAEGRPDIWPAGDLAVQIAVGHILGHDSRPTERQTRTLAEPWRPHRSAAAILAWHHYAHADA